MQHKTGGGGQIFWSVFNFDTQVQPLALWVAMLQLSATFGIHEWHIEQLPEGGSAHAKYYVL